MGFIRGASIVLIATSVLVSGCAVPRVLGLGAEEAAPAVTSTPSISVNGYLWRATLDTMSFMPLITADPWGGVINYDWYTDARTPNERFKATVFILDSRLRADALNVSVTKEVRDANGQWVVQPISPQTETDLENAILTRARQLNLSGAGS